MEYYDLGVNIKAFTTDRTVGRDGDKIRCALMPMTSKLLSIPADFFPLVYPHQTHTDKVYKIDRSFFEKDMAVENNLLVTKEHNCPLPTLLSTDKMQRAGGESRLEGVDAIISDVTNVIFGISTADCIPVVVYDPECHAAAAIHAGWKGTVLRIVEKALAMMQEEYGTDPTRCKAVIGPGISQDSFEVGHEVVDKFRAAGFDMDQYVKYYKPSSLWSGASGAAHFTPPLIKERGQGGEAPHIDLKAVNKAQLIKMGLQPQNITVSSIDTFTDERFFSARREQKDPAHKCGRILTGFMLR